MKIFLQNKPVLLTFGLFLFLIGIAGCSGESNRKDLDTVSSGTLHISVDESFKPVIDSQIQVFEALNPEAKIIAHYKTEAACFEDFKTDSTRMIIVTRGLKPEEDQYYKTKFHLFPKVSKVANDGLAVIVNKNSKDTTFSMATLRGILSGTTGDKQKAVFDGLEGSSGFRFAEDSILRGKSIDPTRVFGEKSSKEVIDFVEKNKDVIGFIGVSWIGNPEDTAQMTFLSKVKIAAVQCNCPENTFVQPYQANIMTMRYPMVRGLYYISKENYSGLATGFSNFLDSERGQLIFRRAYLGPGKMNFIIRSTRTH
ncbi:MAG: substrate-binding domain-containing protein [Ginsengibacter sp.]